MTTLWLSPEQFEQIENHTRANESAEACGLLLGANGVVSEVITATNEAQYPDREYAISPRLISKHLPEIIGFYHSHPGGDALPSQTDKAQAWLGDTIYLIVGTRNGKIRYSAWQFDMGRVHNVPIHTGIHPPDDDPPLSTTQKAAIIISTVAALIVLVTVALELLPPAPSIP